MEEADPLKAFNELSEERQQRFREVRLTFLTGAARILNSVKFVAGAGSLVGDGFSFIFTKAKKTLGFKPEPRESVQRTFRERSQRAVQVILRNLDYKMWSQAPLVIDSNEYGIGISVGLLVKGELPRWQRGLRRACDQPCLH